MAGAVHALVDRELVLERYRPLRPLGRGGSGSVWLARDERTGLDVALKIVPREGKRAARAEREMEAASRLRHEHCVRALDFGEDSGHVYIAYEVVHGHTLRERLRSGSLDDRDAVEAAVQILDALAHAHRKGIVHRDVKPSNVVVADGPTVAVKLLDFGLAQFDEADTLTAVGDVPGTLAYIAPERLDGKDATPKSDVWAVGVMLWEALVGTHPFWGVPLPQVAGAIGRGAPPLGTRRPDLPRRLLACVDSALAVAAADRPAAAELAHELRQAFATPAPRPRTRPAQRRQPRSQPGIGRRGRVRRPHLDLAAVRRRVGIDAAAEPRQRPKQAALEVRLATATLAGAAALVVGTIQPFWPTALLVALTLAAAALGWRYPRLALGVALAGAVFPLGNAAQGAAVLYGAVALVWLALFWRDARCGLLFVAGPLLAPLGLLGVLPLVVQPARGPVRRALLAAGGVLAAGAVAGLRGEDVPLTGAPIGALGVAGADRPLEVAVALRQVAESHMALLTTALVLGLSAALLPYALRRGAAVTAVLGISQIVLVIAWAPTIPWLGIVLSTLLAGALIGLKPALAFSVNARASRAVARTE